MKSTGKKCLIWMALPCQMVNYNDRLTKAGVGRILMDWTASNKISARLKLSDPTASGHFPYPRLIWRSRRLRVMGLFVDRSERRRSSYLAAKNKQNAERRPANLLNILGIWTGSVEFLRLKDPTKQQTRP